MKKLILPIILILFLIPLATATTITEHDVTISSDKDTYYCLPIHSQEGCLIKTQLTVTNNRPGNIATKVYFDSNKPVSIRDYRSKGQEIAVEQSKGKALYSQNNYVISSGETQTFDLEFWTQENGKFNYSVFFNGNWVILDPFFNTTTNTTTPTTHLISGRVSQYNDSEFDIQSNLGNELYDESDFTKFEVGRTEFTDNNLLSFLYEGSSSFLGEVSELGDGSNASNNIDRGQAKYYEANFLSNLDNGDRVEIHFQDGNKISPIYISNTAQTKTFGNFTGTQDADTYFITLEGLTSPTSSFAIYANASIDTGDQEIIDFLSVGETVEGQALRTTFDITLNTENSYFLDIRKVSTGIKTLEVYLYQNNTDALLEKVADTSITAGNNFVPLTINHNISASFRLFTDVIQDISEVSLVENVEDTNAPLVNSAEVNNSNLFCGDTVRLIANATDDFIVNQLDITYIDNTGQHTEMADQIINTDLFYVDVTYNHDTSGLFEVYNISSVTAADVLGNNATTAFNIPYTYSCELLPPTFVGITAQNPANNSEFTNNTGQGLDIVFSVDVNATSNISLYIDGSLNQTIPAIVGTNDFTSVLLTEEKTYTWEVIATANNSDTTGTNDLILTFNAVEIVLLSPTNQVIDLDGYVNFSFDVNTLGNSTLYYNTSLDSTLLEIETLNNVNGFNSFAPIQFSENQTVYWFVNHSYNPVLMSEVYELVINKTKKGPFEEFENRFEIGQCPADSVPNVMLIGIFFLIAFTLIILALVLDIDIITQFMGMIGSIFLIILSWYIATCISLFAWFVAALGLVLLLWFAMALFMGGNPGRSSIF